MGVIRTVTLNSGFDEVVVGDDVRWGEVDRMTARRSDPSGKGVNMARALARLGAPCHAYALVGRPDLTSFGDRLAEEGIPHTLQPVPGRTRRNLTLRSAAAGSPAAHLVAPGFHLVDTEPVTRLFGKVLDDLRPGDLLALNGSLPAGLPEGTWADLVRQANPFPVLLDLQGAALRRALACRAPLAAVPNLREARALLGEPELTAERALQRLTASGVRLPVVTLGGKGSLVSIDGQPQLVSVDVPSPQVLVGAGDAFAAGLAEVLLDRPGDHLAAATWATAVAGAHVAGATGGDLLPLATRLAQRVAVTPGGTPGGTPGVAE